MKHPKSIRWRLLLTMWLTVMLLSLLWIAYSAWESQHGETTMMDGALASEAALVMRTLPTNILTLNASGNFQIKPSDTPSHGGPGGLHFQAWSADNRLLIVTPNTPHARFAPASLDGFATVTYQGERWRVYGLWDVTNAVQVQMGMAQTWGGIAVLYALKAGLKTLLLSLLLAPILAWVVTWSLKPLKQMQAEVLKRQADDLTPLNIDKTATELAPLTGAFNTLLDRLQLSRAAEQRFFADAAHELRTPLAALRLQAQVAAREPDATRRQIALNSMLGGIDRTTRVAEQLLALAKADHHVVSSTHNIGDDSSAFFTVEQVVQEALMALDAEILDRKIQIATDIASLKMHGHSQHSQQISAALRNVIENAIRYSPAGSIVQIMADANPSDKSKLSISVIDQGPGIAPTERENVVKRFYRLPHGNSVAIGSGLGLAIVDRICKNHGGQLVLNDAQSGGLCATLVLNKG